MRYPYSIKLSFKGNFKTIANEVLACITAFLELFLQIIDFAWFYRSSITILSPLTFLQKLPFAMHLSYMCHRPLKNSNGDLDSLMWHYGSSGHYLVKNVYYFKFAEVTVKASSSYNVLEWCWKKLWHIPLPRKF